MISDESLDLVFASGVGVEVSVVERVTELEAAFASGLMVNWRLSKGIKDVGILD